MTRSIRLFLLAALCLAVAPASAQAVTLTYDDGTPATVLQAWADASYVPVAPGEVTIHSAACFNGGRSCTTFPGREMWISPSEVGYTFTPAEVQYTFTHELGHRFDYLAMTEASRARFAQLVGDARPWRTEGGNSPHEKFAEAYGLCFRHRVIQHAMRTGGYDYLPSARTHRRVCQLIRQTDAGAFG